MSREVPSNQGEQSPSLLSLELPPLPPLSPNDLRAGTAGFLADFSLMVEDALRYGHFQEEDRKKIEHAEFLVGQTLEALIDLSSNQDAPKALATISLEDFPENMYRALFFLCKRVPEFRAQILEDPHHRLSGDHPTDFNLLYVAFRRALDTKPKTGTDSQILTLRKERLTALIKLEEKESKTELDRHTPYPVDLERVGREDVRRGAVELHARIAEEEPRLPIELKEDAHRVLSFLEAVFDPEAIEQRSHDDHKLRELLTVARVVQDPEKISLDIFPSKLFDSLLRLKMADVNLNLAFMGHDPHTVKSQVIARREDRNILDQPLPFNLFNLATLNVKQRKSDGEASLEDLYRYDEFTKLQAQHRSSIEIMSADAGARIIEAVAGNGKPWLSRAFAFSQKVLTTPISQLSEVFSDKRKQIRRELEEKLIVEWQELVATDEPNFLKVANQMMQMCRIMEKDEHLQRLDLLQKLNQKAEAYHRLVNPKFALDASALSKVGAARTILIRLEHAKRDWENRYYYPDYLESVVEKENYKLVETIEVGSPVEKIQVMPDGMRMMVWSKDHIKIFTYSEKDHLMKIRLDTDVFGIASTDVVGEIGINSLIHDVQMTPDGSLYIMRSDLSKPTGSSRGLIEKFSQNHRYWRTDFHEPRKGWKRDVAFEKEDAFLKRFEQRDAGFFPDGWSYKIDSKHHVGFYRDNQEVFTATAYEISDVKHRVLATGRYPSSFLCLTTNGILIKRAYDPTGIFESHHGVADVRPILASGCQSLFHYLPGERALSFDRDGNICMIDFKDFASLKKEVLIPNSQPLCPDPNCDPPPIVQMQPDGRIFVGTGEGKVLIFDGKPVKEKE